MNQSAQFVKSVIRFALVITVAAAALCLLPHSCISDDEEAPEVTLRETHVTARGGQQFVSVKATGEWTLSLSEDWASVSPDKGSGSGACVLNVSANTGKSERSCTVTVTGKAGSRSATLVQSGVQGDDSPGEDDPGQGGVNLPGETKAAWLELPATSSDDGFYFVTHEMLLDGRKQRNYSYYYDTDKFVANWVAYPLCSGNIGSGSRTNAWGLDPKLPADMQAVLFSGFKHGNDKLSGIDRGHQCPSADRLNRDANAQTFYFTNMTPQDSKLNQIIWGELEGIVRSYAKACDTLYVVTGCITEGSSQYALDNYGKHVTIPVAYYKALLRRSGSTYGACGFYFEHKANSGSVDKSYMMSIDQLEERAKVDFFVNLPAAIGEAKAAAIEAADPTKDTFWTSRLN